MTFDDVVNYERRDFEVVLFCCIGVISRHDIIRADVRVRVQLIEPQRRVVVKKILFFSSLRIDRLQHRLNTSNKFNPLNGLKRWIIPTTPSPLHVARYSFDVYSYSVSKSNEHAARPPWYEFGERVKSAEIN